VSIQEYALLRRAGVEAVGIAGSCSAVEIGASALTQQAFSRWLSPRGSWELKELTVGVYEARRLAVERLHANAAKLNASGVIGIDLSSSLTGEAPSAAHGHALMVHLLGTAIRAKQIKATDPQAVMRI
jgi:uncharacterized protein YbjQ (UPF0145 family)